jgi:hypothetical protein
MAAQLRRHGIDPAPAGPELSHDPVYLQSVVAAREIQKSDVVLEIGCGLGSLTHRLAPCAPGGGGRSGRATLAASLDRIGAPAM